MISSDDLDAVLDGVEVGEHLATGGQKAVFRATRDGSQVVVKVLPLDNRFKEQRAQREVDAMRLIDSPNFVELLDVKITQVGGTDVLIFLEEFIDGRTLRDHLADVGPSVALGAGIADGLIDLIAEFERHSLVHRDIKPENIMIPPSEEFKLLDVGVVRFLQRQSLTPSFAPHGPGTYNYSSPEQLNNEKSLQDSRSDLFATGIVMFEAMLGRHPFEDATLSIPDAILLGERQPLPDLGIEEELQAQLAAFYWKLTSPEPYQRYRNASYAREAFDPIVRGIQDA